MRLRLVGFLLALCIPLYAQNGLAPLCAGAIQLHSIPPEIDAGKAFEALVKAIHDELIVGRKAPGFVIGISGTDSLVTFLAAAKAFERAGHPERVVGIHYGPPLPSEEALAKDEYLKADFWFQLQVIPWLKQKAPKAEIFVDSSINHKLDGLRWGMMLEWSKVEDLGTGRMRAPEKSYWLMGTRNRTEDILRNYSNASIPVSAQPILKLWKSDILKICAYLNVPKTVLDRSCDRDCACGREQLPAIHIPEVDALLMVELGELDPAYVEATIPKTRREELEEYIREQRKYSVFKEQIPYKIEMEIPRSSFAYDGEIAGVKNSLHAGDTKPLSRLVPQLISDGRANLAADLVGGATSNLDAWLPEVLALFNTPGLRLTHERRMHEKVFDVFDLEVFEAKKLSLINARLGYYGFRFPEWRHLARKYGDSPTLLEQFGMVRLTRSTDVRDAALPPSNSDRDEWGPGFVTEDGEWYIELRRAYILATHLKSTEPVSLIIRNNSYYFGRNRLKHAVYVSWESISVEQLKNLSPRDLETRFVSYRDIFKVNLQLSVEDKTKRLMGVMKRLDAFTQSLSEWLSQGPGAEKLQEFLNHEEGRKFPIFMGWVTPGSPSWFAQPSRTENHSSLILMSGAHGDFP